MDANKLANERRYIIRNKKLTDINIEQVINNIQKENRNNTNKYDNNNDDNNNNYYYYYGNNINNKNNDDADNNKNENKNNEITRNYSVNGRKEEAGDEVKEISELENNGYISCKDEVGGTFIQEERSICDYSGEQNYMTRQRAVDQLKQEIIEELSVVKYTEMSKREPSMKIKQTLKLKTLFVSGNEAVRQIFNEINLDLTELSNLLYATSKSLQYKCVIKPKSTTIKNNILIPKWKKKLMNGIENYRKDISLLSELKKENKIINSKQKKIEKKYKIKTFNQIATVKEELVQKLQLKAQRLRRMNKRCDLHKQNKIFETDAKRFYREISKASIVVKESPKPQ